MRYVSERYPQDICFVYFKQSTVCFSNLKLRHENTQTCLFSPDREACLPRRHGSSSWTSLLLSVMIASIASCGVESRLRAGFLLSGPRQSCTGESRRGVIAHVWAYIPLVPLLAWIKHHTVCTEHVARLLWEMEFEFTNEKVIKNLWI